MLNVWRARVRLRAAPPILLPHVRPQCRSAPPAPPRRHLQPAQFDAFKGASNAVAKTPLLLLCSTRLAPAVPSAAVREFGTTAAASPYGVYLVTDDFYDDGSLGTRVAAAIEGGVTCVQLRLKDCDTRRLIDLGHELQPMCRAAGVPFIVDDRVDVAMALDADGVHIGQSDMPPAMVRELIGPDKILGVTLDLAAPESIREAVHSPARADYLGSNAVFPTATKDTAAYGIDGLSSATKLIAAAAAAAGRAPIPLVAIGGVSAANGAECLAAGAEGLAVVSAILGADSPAESAAELLDLVDAAAGTRS